MMMAQHYHLNYRIRRYQSHYNSSTQKTDQLFLGHHVSQYKYSTAHAETPIAADKHALKRHAAAAISFAAAISLAACYAAANVAAYADTAIAAASAK